MRVFLCATLLLALGVAGCAESSPAATDADTSFDDVKVQVSDTTGAILGVVVNDAILPVAGAKIVLLNTEHSTETDDSGRFSFSDIPAGTYFLDVSKPLHTAVQSSVDVVAGVEKPGITKIQLNRQYSGEPYLVTIPNDGFFTCSQAGGIVWGYSSSPCHSIGWGTNIDLCDDYNLCLDQKRVFHADLGPGWQSLVFEMTWDASAYGTSELMGMSVSTYHPERNKNHWFASVNSADPMIFRINTGEMHATAQEGSGPSGPIPAEGMTDMSMYMSVRQSSIAPAFAIDQEFQTWHSQFYYAPAPEDWSFMAGSPNPF